MMKTKIQIKTYFGSLLFEYEKENNSIKDTLLKAVEQNTNLQCAYLQGADLRGANLRGAYLQCAYLQDANLKDANLQDAYLQGAYLQDANLQYAYLQDANLQYAYLQGANLKDANLQDANLKDANLQYAYLQGAYLKDANLQDAYLQGAYLKDANLQDANLRGAYLRDAYLKGADINKFKHLYQIIPMEGSFIAWKKLSNNCLAKIEIPAKSPRTFSIIGRKCRAKFVKTLNIWDYNGNEIKEQFGQRDKSLIYKVGRLTYSDKWDNDPRVECTHGIHFFISKQEAIEW